MALEIAVPCAVEFVTTSLGHNVDRAAIGKAEFGGEGIAIYLVFLDRVPWQPRHAVLSRTIFVFATIDGGKIVAAIAAANGEAGCGKAGKAGVLAAWGIGIGDARQGVDLIGDIVIEVGKVLHLESVNRICLLRLSHFDD